MFVPLQRNLNDPQTKIEVGLLEEMSCNKRGFSTWFLRLIFHFNSLSIREEKRRSPPADWGDGRGLWRKKWYLEASSGRTATWLHAKIFQVNRCEQFRGFYTSAKLDKAVLFSCESRKKKWTKVWCRRENSLWFRLIKGSIFYQVTPPLFQSVIRLYSNK